ncbi:ATP-binding protein [Roseobacter sp. YSTF-M11]|uniref:ATP-binding protein n=1 Tax=Roseobacter insulae TaxID=2859783 RepID=A0A9X1FS89_9RHOB|nr:ATP-binding protein [Roseobacter insulae]MBW4706646.1 ATP-binding protein [Roseobacter insulae]
MGETGKLINLHDGSSPHAHAIQSELTWLARVIDARLSHFFDAPDTPFVMPSPPQLLSGSALAHLVGDNELSDGERLVIALAIAPHVNSAILDPFFVKNAAIDRAFSQFGGQHSGAGGFQPTTETALFLLAGADTAARIAAMAIFEADRPLRRRAGITLGTVGPETKAFGNLLDISVHRLIALCEGTPPRPDFSPSFPAQRLQTSLDWSDLVLPRDLHYSLGHIIAWLENRDRILSDWGLHKQFGKGFKALFYGPPGTGKTLTASLLGKRTGMDVYRVDLSMVVSKYIGETEKNLGLVFDMAAEREWILFFDEADALFGARSATTSSNDRYANQEVAYLLQRIEDCESLVILATNLRSNIDDAFFRRFQMSVGFVKPDASQREQIWNNVLADVPLADDVDVRHMASEFALVGGAISNVARTAAITALRRDSDTVTAEDFKHAITIEMRKEGRTS